MPTMNDETLHERYQRETAGDFARLEADLAAKDAEIADLKVALAAWGDVAEKVSDECVGLRAELAVAREALSVLARVAEEANDYTNVPTFSPSMHRDLRDALETARAAIKGKSQ